jgi:deoxyribonuclease V
MAERIILEDPPGDIHSVAGVDAAYSGDEAYAVCVVMNSKVNVTESRSSITSAPFPYIPGYLAFREAPAILSATIKTSGFDVLFVNGHGVAHPRGCGLATFVGLELDMPTIGVAKRMLVGDVETEGEHWAPIFFEGGVVGAKIRNLGKAPIYVSTGHRMSLESSVEIVRGLLIEGSLPEPLRLAHVKAEEERRRARL